MFVGPAFIRSALSAMLLIGSSVQAAAPYRIQVQPGDTSVPKGSDQTIKAKLLGFSSEGVTLMVRRAAGMALKRASSSLLLTPTRSGGQKAG